MTDEYGCCRLDPAHAKKVFDALISRGTVVFPLSGDAIGCMIVLVSTDFLKIGIMPYGGNPSGRAYVGVYGHGFNHLSMDKEPIHPGYLKEKLNLSEQDADTFSKFWEMIWSHG